MEVVDWREKATELRKLGGEAKSERQSEEVYRTLEAVSLELDAVVERLAHVEKRVQELTREVATIESRVHEDVE